MKRIQIRSCVSGNYKPRAARMAATLTGATGQAVMLKPRERGGFTL